MPIRDPDPTDTQQLIGTRHATTGIEFPPPGLQPYHDWLIRTLAHLADASCGALRVARDADTPTAVVVMPGRATLASTPIDFPGVTLDLAAHNNTAVLLALIVDAGAPAVHVAPLADGWPADPHIKLAQVTLAAGVVTAIVDRRFESIFKA